MPPMVARREAFLHRIIARDFPEPGCFTVVGMDGSSGREVAGGMVRAYLRMLNVIARPVEGNPNKTNATIFLQMDIGLPWFMANFFVRNVMPRLVSRVDRGYEQCKDDPMTQTFAP